MSDHAHARGMKTVLWFEPERVHAGSWLFRKHPDWLLGQGGDRLLNMGNPEARRWLTDHIDRFLTEQGIDLYRQDFNIDPLGFWRANDSPDRQGITEIRHVEGYLAFWDELRRRHPDLLIDSCASGGRRNDLETLRRSVPLLRSDFQAPQNPNAADMLVGNQGHTYGLSFWVPYYGTGVFYDNVYAVRSHLTPALGIGFPAGSAQVDWAVMRRRIADWKLVADDFLGDYYPLSPYSLSEHDWIAWQFDRPSAGSGMVQAFRRTQSDEASRRLKLCGLDQEATYELRDLDRESPIRATGRVLMSEGLLAELRHRPQALLIKYRRLEGRAASSASSVPKSPLQAECDALFKEAMDAIHAFTEGIHKAKTDVEARKYSLPDLTAYAARFLAMAKAHPDDPAAVDAWVRVICVDFYGPHWKEAIEQIRARYVQSPRIGLVLRTIAFDTTPPSVEPILRAVLKDNPSAEVRAQAAVALAQHLSRLMGEAENMRAHPDRFEHAVSRFGRDEVTRMRDRDTQSMNQEVEALYELVIRDYADVPGEERDVLSPAEVARAELHSLRDLIVGKPAPEIEGKDVDGKPMKLSDYRGKVVVLSFWATWCGPCMMLVPQERELVRRMVGKPFVLLGVNGDEDKDRLMYQIKEHQINWRSFYAGGPYGPICRDWNVEGWPTVYVIDRNGIIRYKGARDEKKLDRAVEELLKSGS